MKKFFILSAMLILFVSCGNKKEKFYPAKEESFSKFVNDKALPKDPNMNLDKSIINRDYPIQIALYSDHRFYYDLPNLDDGTGTWSFDGGGIILKAKQRLFDMKIDIRALDPDAKNVGISFIDRHGPQELRMEKENLE